MDNINLIIGNNLNSYRKSKGYSLDKVAEMTGVSKGMLGQIERGETNPSISTLWKIANGLHISSTSLLEAKPDELAIVKKEELAPMKEDNDKYIVYPAFPFDFKKKFEVMVVDLEVGCIHRSEPHDKDVEEFIYVSKGEFDLIMKDTVYSLKEGDSIKFLAENEHTYINNSKERCTLHTIIYYNNI